MTTTYGPFEAGAGATSTGEAQWRNLFAGISAPGVISSYEPAFDMNRLSVFGDSTGMQVKVRSGRGFCHGFWFVSDAEEILAIAASDPTNPRIDLVVLRFDFTANTVTLAVKAGTPNPAPLSPLTLENSATIWEIPLAEVLVGAGVSTITAGSVTDRRLYAGASGQTAATVNRSTALSLTSGVVTAVPFDTLEAGNAAMWSSANPTRLVCRVPGLYVPMGMGSFAPSATGDRSLQMRKNGTTTVVTIQDSANTVGADGTAWTLTRPPLVLAAADYLELMAYQGSGGALNLLAGAAFGMHRVGAS